MRAFCNHMLELTGPAGDVASPVHRLDPRAKIVALLAVTVVAVSAPLGGWPVWVGCASVLGAVAVSAHVSARVIWKRAGFVLPLVLLVATFVPFVRGGGQQYDLGPLVAHEEGLRTLAEVAAKATIGTLSAVLLGATTPFPEVLRGLEAMRAPRVLVVIAAFMYRYLYVIVDEVVRMCAALTARAYRPRSALHAGALGRVATATFLRTYARGERVYRAMVSRGYRGHMPRLAPLVLRRADILFVALVLVALVPLRVVA